MIDLVRRRQRETALRVIVASWCTLRAWQPVDMRSVHLLVKFRRGWSSSGEAHVSRTHGQADILVRLGDDEADGLSVLLHELAHVAAQRRGHNHHDSGWRSIFRTAAEEILGEEIPDGGGGNRPLTDRIADAFRRKWRLRLSAGRTERLVEDEKDVVL